MVFPNIAVKCYFPGVLLQCSLEFCHSGLCLLQIILVLTLYRTFQGFLGGSVVKNPPATGSIPGPGRSHMLRSN